MAYRLTPFCLPSLSFFPYPLDSWQNYEAYDSSEDTDAELCPLAEGRIFPMSSSSSVLKLLRFAINNHSVDERPLLLEHIFSSLNC